MSLIEDVSDTAFMVATYRAMETALPNPLFRDPLAGKLAGTHGENIVRTLPPIACFGQWFVVIRTCIIDAFIERALAEGIDTVLNLGAGLDTRPYRMDLPEGLHWIEVDYPKIIELKENRLADDKPRCRLDRVALDLADLSARRQLLSKIASQSKKTLVLTEGVILYLETHDVALLADDLRAESAFQYWIVDYLSPEARQHRRRLEKKMKMANAPFLFDPGDYFSFFAEHGWGAKETRYLADEAEGLNRPLQLPFMLQLSMKLASLLAPKKRREAFRRSSAYVLLEPRSL